jgi:hypothetical protein
MQTRDGADIVMGSAAPARVIRPARPPMMMPPPPVAPPAGGTLTQEMRDFAAAAIARPEGSHSGMGMDAAMRREMVLATHVLAPRALATHVAIQDGDWSDPTTWYDVDGDAFGVPGAGARVLIPSGIQVDYDIESDAAINTIRLDGALHFPHDQSTKLVVDTIIQDHGSMAEKSRLQIASAESPLEADKTCEIVFPGDTDLDPAVDTLLLGRGIVTMGEVFIFGAPKTPWADCSQTRSVGDTTITLDAAPEGWRIGDRLTICATTMNDALPRGTNLDDEVTITDISGATITFTPALAHPRALPTHANFSHVRYAVANFTRNVTIHSPAGTPVHRRGHVMFMHDQVVSRYAAWDWLGRTRKDIRSWNATDDERRIQTMGGDVPWAPTSNVRGRYNFHVHRAGVTPGQNAADVYGNAATEAPGWLYAHHSSFAHFHWNVGRRFFGAGLVSEAANEYGTWEHNLMCSSYAGARPPTSPNEKSSGNDAIEGDVARNGTAYWLASRAVIIKHNRVFACSSGYIWLSRYLTQGVNPILLPEPRAFYFESATESLSASSATIHNFIGNEACAVWAGIIVIKANPNQGHRFRSWLHNTTLWNVRDGAHAEYTGHYTVSNFRALHFAGGSASSTRHGFNIGQENSDFVLSDSVIDGWSRGIWVNTARIFGFALHKVFNTTFSGTVNWGGNQTDLIDNPLMVEFLGPEAVADRDAPVQYLRANVVATSSSGSANLTGDIADALGQRTRRMNDKYAGWSVSRAQLRRGLSIMGYWTHGGENYFLLPDIISPRIPKSDGTLPPQYFTVPVRLTSDVGSLADYTNNGPLPAQYLDGGNVIPVVSEDIFA